MVVNQVVIEKYHHRLNQMMISPFDIFVRGNETMKAEILQQFCDIDREDMKKPYSEDDFTYATNEHILIRVPRMDGIEESLKGPVIKEKAVAIYFSKEPTQWFPVSPIYVEQELCLNCKGTGRLYTCHECEGEGQVIPWTDWNDYDEQTCRTCDGNGQLEAACIKCDGTGKIWNDKSVPIGGVYFSDRYLSWLYQLPNCEIGPFGTKDPARFRFDGGEGLIMPRSK
ncbi:MAG: hypothetical protein AB1401_00805 [Thermodesulfobacteriota bacterium]